MAEKGGSNGAANPTNNSQVKQAAASTTFTLAPRSGLKSFVSQNSKVGFYFKPNPGNTQFDVKEVGNKITVFETSNPNINQHLEIFPKNPSDTIEQAITNSVLSGYSSSDCPIKVQSLDSHFPSSYTTATLNYSPSNQIKNGWGIADTSKCPVAYTVNYDSKFFVVDNNHPDRLVFFNLGQL